MHIFSTLLCDFQTSTKPVLRTKNIINLFSSQLWKTRLTLVLLRRLSLGESPGQVWSGPDKLVCWNIHMVLLRRVTLQRGDKCIKAAIKCKL